MPIIITEQEFDPESDSDTLKDRIDEILKGTVISCKLEERDGKKLIVTVSPDLTMRKAAKDAGKHPRELFAADVNAALASSDGLGPNSHLGKLSQKYESGGDAGAIGHDRTGGWSYGLYQLASNVGSIAAFLKFLAVADSDMAKELEAAGGDSGARAGTPQFKGAWKKLAGEQPRFAAIQHEYIKRIYYDTFVEHVKGQVGIDINERHAAIKDVAWSTAVQHGQKNRIFKLALDGILPNPPQSISDASIIDAVYDERSKVNRHFKSSTQAVKDAVRNRFVDERQVAHGMLNA